MQSLSTNRLYSALICSFAAVTSPETPSPLTTLVRSASDGPVRMSTGTLMIFSGELCARSSMDVPPSLQAVNKCVI